MTTNLDSLKGTFWQSNTPDHRVSGELTINGRPTLETFRPIFDGRAVDVEWHPSGAVKRMAVSGNPDHLVADWEPRTIHGELEDGTLVSVVGAQEGRQRSTSFVDLQYRQEFRTSRTPSTARYLIPVHSVGPPGSHTTMQIP